MNKKEIVERGLIAYCIIFFSVNVVNGIIVEEQLKKENR